MLSPVSLAVRGLTPIAAGLLLSGCAVSSSEPASSPQVTGRGDATSVKVVTPTAPLMPSSFFAGGAEAFVAWRCIPDQDLVAAYGDDELRLWSVHGARRLTPAVVASGARYQQGELSVWDKGEEAVVEGPRGRLDCTRDLAREAMTRQDRPGVMFHARGNEPGWTLSLPSDLPELDLLLDYGERQLTLPYRVTALDNAEGRMLLASGRADRPFELRLEAGACFDSMSGEPFPTRVTLTLDGETYRGCGQGIAP